uniref:Uncharacterized protein n=1 Tax=Setaria digitata TaxID=48799 RepID=A0A915PV26_9BILA
MADLGYAHFSCISRFYAGCVLRILFPVPLNARSMGKLMESRDARRKLHSQID